MTLSFPDIDPIIFSFSVGNFEFALRWYALAYIVGLLVAWKIMVKITKTPKLWQNSRCPVAPILIEDLMTYMVVGVILGGRAGYVLFYQPIYFLGNPLEIFQVWKGGMSFHGGFLGVVFGAIIFAKKNGIPILNIGDLVALSSPPGLFLGRLANFINGELWGKPTQSSFGILFPSELARTCPEKWVGLCTRHPSQLYEAIFEGLILWLILLVLVYKFRLLRWPGETIAVFLFGYGSARFFIEFFRAPDLQFVSDINPQGFILQINDWFGVSMGQLLSLPMIIVGIIVIIWSRTTIKPSDFNNMNLRK